MKVKFRHAVKSFQGKFKSEGLVYCKYNDGALYLTRKYPCYTPSDHNHEMGDAGRNLGKLFRNISPDYKNDLRTYSKLMTNYTNLEEKIPPNCYANFMKMMFALKKLIPDVDLATITKEDILKNEYPVCSIAQAMEEGLLLDIPEANMLTNGI
jgi:hypothetical protein